MITTIHKWIIGFKPIMYTPVWWWYRLILHRGFRFDDYTIWASFWYSINDGWEEMEYINKFEEFWGKGSYPPETITLSQKDYDSLVEKLNEPPQRSEALSRLMNRKSPWDD